MGPDSFILPGDMQLRVYISVLLVQQDSAVTIIAKYGNIVFHGWSPLLSIEVENM